MVITITRIHDLYADLERFLVCFTDDEGVVKHNYRKLLEYFTSVQWIFGPGPSGAYDVTIRPGEKMAELGITTPKRAGEVVEQIIKEVVARP